MKKIILNGPILKKRTDKYYFANLFADERRFTQVIVNFLSNSIKFTPQGGHVEVSLNILNLDDIQFDES